MINVRSLSLELIILALIGLVAQNMFVSGNLNPNGFYNKYLGFSLLFPIYALMLSGLIYFLKLKSKFFILFLSVFLLAIATIVNIALYPAMGGSTGQLYGAWALFFVMPLISLPLGLSYGGYKIYTNRDMSFVQADTSQMKTLKSNNTNIIGPIWFISLFMILILPYFIFMSGSHSSGTIYVRLLLPSMFVENFNFRMLMVLISMMVGVGLLYRSKWMRWTVLFLAYYAIVNYAIVIVLNSVSFSLQPPSLVAFSIPFLFIYILNREVSFVIYQLDKTLCLKENSILAILAVALLSFEIAVHKLFGA
ncbi:MAG: hypothetical protein BV457_08505 [Thermoplasmata archaeon M9B1D]|nr:MAG: hypothetical protein BV457_08505 [Thermoplasmata archaeon M9B1D]PNX46447.1 MAG: hypothetical protein BV456_12220 [Thermoplasmata archaeon M8B2D]